MIWRFPSPLLRRQATSCYINNKITSLPQQEEKLYVRFQVQLIFGAKLKPKSATLIFFPDDGRLVVSKFCETRVVGNGLGDKLGSGSGQ